jgi:hypothetical protein
MRWAGQAAALVAGLAGAAGVLVSQSFQMPQLPPLPEEEVLLRAMRDEMARVPLLAVVGGADAPYFVSYTVSDAHSVRVSSVLGATVNVARNEYRAPAIEVRVGSYEYDQTGHVQSGAYSGTRLDGVWPLDANYAALRNSFWLATDVAFKAALESLARKRASQQNAAADPNPLPNFSRVEPVVSIPKIVEPKIDPAEWTARANRLSGIFKRYPEILASGVDVQAMTGITTMLTSEGTMIRYEDGIAWIMAKAEAQAADGMLVHDAVSIQSLTLDALASEAELMREMTEMAENVRALARAPAGEAYTGPVLFEPRAAAQLLAQLLGDHLRISRRPLTNPGQAVNLLPSELESRLNARVLPEFFDVVADATQRSFNGRPLVGFYEFDLEGVRPRRVQVIEKGILKNFLTTRTPVRGFPVSNGHARLPGNFGARTAAPGNLFVTARESAPLAQLREQLLARVRQLEKPYGLLVRKLDFPYAGSTAELQALAQANQQAGGAARPVSPPLLVYRVYPDGREELVRGLRFQRLSTRALRDVVAASSETAVFEYVNTTTALAMLGSGGYLAPTSVISPGLLFEELEFDVPREQLPKPPTVPPPAMTP